MKPGAITWPPQSTISAPPVAMSGGAAMDGPFPGPGHMVRIKARNGNRFASGIAAQAEGARVRSVQAFGEARFTSSPITMPTPGPPVASGISAASMAVEGPALAKTATP